MVCPDEYFHRYYESDKRAAARARNKQRKADREAAEAAAKYRFVPKPALEPVNPSPSASALTPFTFPAYPGAPSRAVVRDGAPTNLGVGRLPCEEVASEPLRISEAEPSTPCLDESPTKPEANSPTSHSDETPTKPEVELPTSYLVKTPTTPEANSPTSRLDESSTKPEVELPTSYLVKTSTTPVVNSPTSRLDESATDLSDRTPTNTLDPTSTSQSTSISEPTGGMATPSRVRKSHQRDCRALQFLKVLEARATAIPVNPTRPPMRRWVKMSEAAHYWLREQSTRVSYYRIPRFPPWRDATDMLKAVFYHRSISAEPCMVFSFVLSPKISKRAFACHKGVMFEVRETLSRCLRRTCREPVDFWFGMEIGEGENGSVLRGAVTACGSQAVLVKLALQKLAHKGAIELTPIKTDPHSLMHDDEWPQEVMTTVERSSESIGGSFVGVSSDLKKAAETLYRRSSPIVYFDY